MSEKNEEIAQEIRIKVVEQGATVFDLIVEALDTKDRDHEALIGVLVGAITSNMRVAYDEGIRDGRDITTKYWKTGDIESGKFRTHAIEKLINKALSHPLVQEYLKKEKSDHDFKTCLCHPDGGG